MFKNTKMFPKLKTECTEKGDLLKTAYAKAIENLCFNTVGFSLKQYNKTGLILQNGEFIRAGLRYEKPWTRDCAVNVWYAAALLLPEQAKNTLWAVCEREAGGKLAIQNDNQWWDKLIWVFGAWEYYVINDDIEFLKKAFEAAKTSFENAVAKRFNKKKGLFFGPAVMADGISGYPEPPYHDGINDPFVLSYEGTESIMTLSTNCVYYKAASLIAKTAKHLGLTADIEKEYADFAIKLRTSINQHFWDAGKNNYKYIIFENKDCVLELNEYTEAIGISFAILFDIADEDKMKKVVKSTFVDKMGIPLVWPHFSRFNDNLRGRHNASCWPIVSGFWALAAAKSGANEIFYNEIEKLIEKVKKSDWNFYEVYNPVTGLPDGGWQADFDGLRRFESCPHQTWSAAAFLGMVFRGLFGLSFNEEGICFQPAFPNHLGEMALLGLRYRNIELDVYLWGKGEKMDCILLDSKKLENPLIPAEFIAGKHIVEIFTM